MLLPPAGVSGKSDPCAPGPQPEDSPGAGSDSDLSGLRTLYLQAEGRLDFSAWNTAIAGAAGGGGTGLQEQQMSRGDIPIIVDACISFVTQHGEWVLADTELVRDGEHGHCWLDGIEEGDVHVTCLQTLCLQRLQPDSDKLLCLSEPQFPHL